MKKLLFLLIAAITFFMVSCKDKNTYTILGTIEATDSTYVYLADITYVQDRVKLDSAMVIDGKFEMKGVAPISKLCMIIANNKGTYLFIEPGNISVSISQYRTGRGGTPLNEEYNRFLNEITTIEEEVKVISLKIKELSENDENLEAVEALKSEKKSSINKKKDFKRDYIKNNINNIIGGYLLMIDAGSFSEDEIRELIPQLNDQVKNLDTVKQMEKYLNEERVEKKELEIGQTFVDFKGKDLKGNNSSISDFGGKGKVLLIDFWASWCAPCRAQIPDLIKIYEKMANDKFEIVGISLDSRQSDWEKGTEALNIPWPQISDLKMWESEVVTSYGIQGIPYLILLDKEGVIVAKNIHGEELEKKIEEMLSK